MALADAVTFSPRGEYEAVTFQPLRGRAVFVIGGGPGFIPAKHAALLETDPILVNNAYTLVRSPHVVVAFDHRWHLWHGANVRAARHCLVCALRPGQRVASPAHTMEKDSLNAWNASPWVLAGRNSGHGAVALAMHLGAVAIYLAGFDMTFRGQKQERTHWHSGHKVPSSLPNYELRFKPSLEALVDIAANMGIRVSAVTPSLAAIPHTPLDMALEHVNETNRKSMDHSQA